MKNIGNEPSHVLFISDLHLCHTRPRITQQFITFLQTTAAKAQSLYILGDLFEYWAGDDDIEDEHNQSIIYALKALATTGTQIFFIHGNRDFLLSHGYANAAGIQLLDDPTVLSLYGNRVLLSHGDTLCTDDKDYQDFRRQVRDPTWQQSFLNQPLPARKAQIEAIRQRSENEKSIKSESIMDVNTNAVDALIRAYNYPDLLIHGHTHRPAKHLIEVDGHACQRWVLGDWYEQGSYLRYDASGIDAGHPLC